MFFSRVSTSELGACVVLHWDQFPSLWRTRVKHNLTHLSLQFSLPFLSTLRLPQLWTVFQQLYDLNTRQLYLNMVISIKTPCEMPYSGYC